MLTLGEAVIIRTANDRVAELERNANHSIRTLQAHLQNERAARRGDRAAHEAEVAMLREEIAMLREIATEAMARA